MRDGLRRRLHEEEKKEEEEEEEVEEEGMACIPPDKRDFSADLCQFSLFFSHHPKKSSFFTLFSGRVARFSDSRMPSRP